MNEHGRGGESDVKILLNSDRSDMGWTQTPNYSKMKYGVDPNLKFWQNIEK